DHRADLRDFLRHLSEAVEPARQVGPNSLQKDGLVFLELIQTAKLQYGLRHLLYEQRDVVCPDGNRFQQGGRQLVVFGNVLDDGKALVPLECRELLKRQETALAVLSVQLFPQRCRQRLGCVAIVMLERTMGEDDQRRQRFLPYEGDQFNQEIGGRRIHPVHVFEDEKERQLPGYGFQLLGKNVDDLIGKLGRRQPFIRGLLPQSQEGSEHLDG